MSETEAETQAGPSIAVSTSIRPGTASGPRALAVTYTMIQGNHPNPMKLATFIGQMSSLSNGARTTSKLDVETKPFSGNRSVTMSCAARENYSVVYCELIDSVTNNRIGNIKKSSIINNATGQTMPGWSVSGIGARVFSILRVTHQTTPVGGGGQESISVLPTFQISTPVGQIPTVDILVDVDPGGNPCTFKLEIGSADSIATGDESAGASYYSESISTPGIESITVEVDSHFMLAVATLYNAQGAVVATDSFVWARQSQARESASVVGIESQGSHSEMTLLAQ